MQGDYSRFRASYAHEELAEHFLLTPAEHQLMAQCRCEVNRQGVAVLLTSLRYLGYFPPTLHEVPTDVTTFIAHQLGLLWEPRLPYPADEHTRRYHLALIRQDTGWRAPTAQDKTTLEQWLRCEGARDASTEEELLDWNVHMTTCAASRLTSPPSASSAASSAAPCTGSLTTCTSA
jgi:hypothetical protein